MVQNWSDEFGPQERVGSTEVEMAIQINAGNYGSMLIEVPRAIITGASFDSSGRDNIVKVLISTPTKKISQYH